MIELNIYGDLTKCGPDCAPFLAKWAAWCQQFDGNRLALVYTDDRYYDSLDRKSRAMIRKAEARGYVYGSFNYNDHLDSIFEINTSKETRQGKPMTEAYLEKPTPINDYMQRCHVHRYNRLGAFKDGKLRAYCAMATLNELAILNTIIGHADALPDGVMNGLIHYIVMDCSYTPGVKYLNYLTIESSGESLQAFKRSVGFESYQVRFV